MDSSRCVFYITPIELHFFFCDATLKISRVTWLFNVSRNPKSISYNVCNIFLIKYILTFLWKGFLCHFSFNFVEFIIIINNYSSSPNGLVTQRPRGSDEGERNNYFSKMRLVDQKYREKKFS